MDENIVSPDGIVHLVYEGRAEGDFIAFCEVRIVNNAMRIDALWNYEDLYPTDQAATCLRCIGSEDRLEGRR